MPWKNKFFYLSLACLSLVSVANLTFSLLIKYLVDSLSAGQMGDFYRYLGFLFLAMLVLLLVEYGQQVLSRFYLNQMAQGLETAAVDQALTQRPRPDSAQIMSMIVNDIESLEEVYFESLLFIGQGIISFVLSVWVIFSLDGLTAGALLVMSLLPVLIPYLMENRLSQLEEEVSHAREAYLQRLTDVLAGLVVLKNSRSLSLFTNRLSDSYRGIGQAREQKARLSSLTNVLVGACFYGTTLVLLWLGGRQVLAGQLTLGSLMALYAISTELVTPIQTVATALTDLRSASALLGKWQSRQSLEPLLADVLTRPDLLPGFTGLRANQLSLTLEGKTILAPQTFHIRPGDKCLVKGDNGRGKSTLLELLTGNRPASPDQLFLNGQDASQLSYASLQSVMAYMPQTPFVSHETVLDNLTLGQPYVQDQVWHLLRLVGLTDRFPDWTSLEEKLEQDGQLSGGQEQKLALVRALLQNKPVLVMDEALSALDEASCQAIEAYLLGRKDLTLIHVSHRPPTGQYDQVIRL